MRDDPLECLDKIFQELADDQNVQERMMALIENLYKDLEMRDQTISSLQNNINKLTSIETFGITSKYVALQDEQVALKTKIKDLENTIDDLNTQLIGKDVEMQKKISEKEDEMKEKMKQKDEELRVVQERVHELYTEVEEASVFSATQWEHEKSSYQKQHAEIDKKFKDCLHTCNILRTELFNAKEKCNEYKRKIADMKHCSAQLQNLHNFQNQEVGLNTTSSSIHEFPSDSNSKYPPLEINRNNISTDSSVITINNSEAVTEGRLFEIKKPTVYRSGTRFWSERAGNSKNKNILPPLFKPNSNNNNNKENSPIKKRKLFNPDDLSYLNNETEEGEDIIP